MDSQGRQFSGAVVEFTFDAHNRGERKSEFIWIEVIERNFSIDSPSLFEGGNTDDRYLHGEDPITNEKWMLVRGPQVLPGKSRAVRVNIFFESAGRIEWRVRLFLTDTDMDGASRLILPVAQKWEDFSTVNVC